MNMNKGNCSVCYREGLNKCSKCNVVRYCSVECQKMDWTKHKTYCSKYKFENQSDLGKLYKLSHFILTIIVADQFKIDGINPDEYSGATITIHDERMFESHAYYNDFVTIQVHKLDYVQALHKATCLISIRPCSGNITKDSFALCCIYKQNWILIDITKIALLLAYNN